MAVTDLSNVHGLISNLFHWPASEAEWKQYQLSDEQIKFFKENGYLAGVKMLDEMQIEKLKTELNELADSRHPGHSLFYEFHSNESADPSTILFPAQWDPKLGIHVT